MMDDFSTPSRRVAPVITQGRRDEGKRDRYAGMAEEGGSRWVGWVGNIPRPKRPDRLGDIRHLRALSKRVPRVE